MLIFDQAQTDAQQETDSYKKVENWGLPSWICQDNF